MLKHVFRNIGGEPNQRVIVTNVDAVDLAAMQIALVGQGADDIAWLHAVPTTDLDSKHRLRALWASRSPAFPLAG